MRKKGFTLIELLVTISVIALLMSILVPALAKARQRAEGVVCLSNLRQMAIAAVTYAQTHDGFYPIAHYRRKDGPVKYECCWDFTTVTNSTTGGQEIVPGLLWQGGMTKKIQQCPSFGGQSNTAGDPFTGYNYNTSYIGHGGGERVGATYDGQITAVNGAPAWYKIVMPVKIHRVRQPAQCALFGDGQYSGGANKFMRAPWAWDGDIDNSLKSAGTQGYRHGGRTNVAWCDGHVSSQELLYTETVAEAKSEIEDYNKKAGVKIGFLSPDNSVYDTQ
jgi:prepilin-type N-terminal cleavage/methylation domain-containing protein/prepilin-type processing-associated H-X9-DG protein